MEKGLVHEMVPEHELLTEKDIVKLLDKYNISKAQLPSILIGDPAIKGLKVETGDVVKITRINSVTGTSHAFRVVTTL